MTAAIKETRRARFEALLGRVRAFLALHSYEGDVEPGTFEHVRNCPSCGRAFEIASKHWPGGRGVWVFWAEEDRRWRVEVRFADDHRVRVDVRDGQRSPVLAMALLEVQR